MPSSSGFLLITIIAIVLNINQTVDHDTVASLADGNHQFCSQPQQNESAEGRGICFYFTKTGDLIDGYYAYPRTDDLICLRGKVENNRVRGEALTISWSGREWTNIPKTEFKWDEEGHLRLQDSKIIRTSIDGSGRTDWILFRSADLDIQGFYQYPKPRLISLSQLCKWQ